MNRLTQAVVLLLFGGAVIKATLSGMFLRYVKEGLRPLLLVAGALLIAAALAAIWYEFRSRTVRDGPAPADDGHGHGHAHHEPRIGWLLLLPALALLLVAPPALGSYSAGQAGAVTVDPASGSDYPPLAAGDPVPISMLNYASRAIYDGGKSLAGRQVKMTGFVTPGPDGQPMLARIVLICCAADGLPVKLGLTGNIPQGVTPDSWIEVVGVYDKQVAKDPVSGATIAYVEVRTWQPIPVPKQPYA